MSSATGLETIGLRPTHRVHWNDAAARLVEMAVQRHEGHLTASGALAVRTGKRTGRSPNDKYIVLDRQSEQSVHWGKVNQPMTPETFDRLLKLTTEHLSGKELFVVDAVAGADARHALPIRVVTPYAWHALFARQLFRRPAAGELRGFVPGFTVIGAPDCHANAQIHTTNSEAYVVIDFGRRIVLIGGTHYAGEIKKSIFTVLNHVLPDAGVFPMHCSANAGDTCDVALFFGLSGTGKTTLSADPGRRLIGDDEHGWSDAGVFNFEGGCYAKCIHLSEAKEPQIYRAMRFGSVLENVELDETTRRVNFDSAKYTENTRAAYPIEFIDNALPEGRVDAHPKAVIFLTCDASGVLPPIGILTPEQAMYHFLSGYTAKVAGTEAGVGSEPQATFSTCFGAPFLPRDPMVYATMLADKLRRHGSKVYLVNTGWCGGAYGEGKRIDLPVTRAIVTGALRGALVEGEFDTDATFGIKVPRQVEGVSPELLTPRRTWKNPAAYDAKARELAGLFVRNFEKFASATAEVRAAGPRA
jgi:phosphoenolpyruvate carboxykinase (ATP)